MMPPHGKSEKRWQDFFELSYLLLALVGISSNTLAFLYSLHLTSSGILREGSPHMGELMAFPPVAWLTGFLIYMSLYAVLYFVNRPSSYVRLILCYRPVFGQLSS